ncbi:MAG: hypothetical protein A3B37_00480 [Candidatus Sungbacteria bacterium RIFCSPLOWO2_01_FULL_59_16]|uniref:Uncharacterized protein n=1 Tax=Candidatus Sungbacteria bacterium RIFCSPLOWO2_01_FULL_59_16 TaxID=1802280 RepID=A0A1G2LDC8_9BACT|nr:MAG: hypothetical protein A3B37_00480 [Candidatus Sungbacteria bacterium RIFCSPLOWO2_01_FULL_59_16]
MWPAVKQFILTLFLPIAALFSFSAEEPPTPSSVPPPAAERLAVPQPAMRESPQPTASGAGAEAAVSAAGLKACLAKAGESGKCLDRIFREFLSTRSTADALALVRRYEAEDSSLRLSCHPIVHAIGRETFRIKRAVDGSFAACDQTCHSGCYHGAMERFLRGDAASDDEAGHLSLDELREKAAAACDPNEAVRFRFQCLHGLGHAIMFFSGYDLRQSLAACDATADAWSRSSCYGGVFMENVFSATPEKRDLSPTDPHYPCSKLEEKYQSDCYMMQTTRMSEMGLATPALFAACRDAGDYRHTCMQSIGRDLSNDARVGDPRLVAEKCGLGAGEERRACTRGVAYALIDNTWDGRYAFPFCAAFRDAADAEYCFGTGAKYLSGTFEKSPASIREECGRYAPGSQACLDAAL